LSIDFALHEAMAPAIIQSSERQDSCCGPLWKY